MNARCGIVFFLLATLLASCSDSQTATMPASEPGIELPTETPLPPPATASPTLTVTPTPIPLVWEKVYDGSAFVPDKVVGLAFGDNDPSLIYIHAQNSGYYVSNDGGELWHPISYKDIDTKEISRLNSHVFTSFEDQLISAVSPDGKKILYKTNACYGGDVWCISKDGGKTWQRFSQSGEFFSAAFSLDENGMVYVVCGKNICKFTPDTTQLTILGEPNVGFITLIRVFPQDPNIIYVAGNGLVISRDGGHTWEKINNGLGNYFLHLETNSDDSPVLFLTSGGCIEAGGKGGVRQPLYGSKDGGVTWELLTQEGCYLIKDADGSTLYRHGVPENTEPGPYTSGFILRSLDKGKSWQEITNITSGIHTLIAHPQKSGLLYAYDNHVPIHNFVSTDFGSSWVSGDSTIRPCYGATSHFLDRYKPMGVDPLNSNHVFYVENNHLMESQDGCESSTGNPVTIPSTSKINSVEISPNNSNTLYLGADDGAYVSFDSGATWNQINTGLPDLPIVYSIAVDKAGKVYAATPFGIYQLFLK